MSFCTFFNHDTCIIKNDNSVEKNTNWQYKINNIYCDIFLQYFVVNM